MVVVSVHNMNWYLAKMYKSQNFITDEDGLTLCESDCRFPGGKCEVGVTGGVPNSDELRFGVNESNWAIWFETEYPEATGKYLGSCGDENGGDLKLFPKLSFGGVTARCNPVWQSTDANKSVSGIVFCPSDGGIRLGSIDGTADSTRSIKFCKRWVPGLYSSLKIIFDITNKINANITPLLASKDCLNIWK